MSMRNTARLPALDGLRGVLAVVVLADHALTALGSFALGLAANVSVAMFFCISGLVLTRAWNGGFAVFLLRRFVRLWPLFAISLASAGLLAWRLPALPEFLWIPLPSYDADVLCPPMWSLFIEAWAALAMPAIAWSGRGGPARTLGCMALCIGLVATWWPSHLGLRAFLSYLVCFVAGAGLSRASLRSQLLEMPGLQRLGQLSYSLYLTHWLVLQAFTDAFGRTGTLLGVPACFAVAQLAWRYVEQPSIELARRTSERLADSKAGFFQKQQKTFIAAVAKLLQRAPEVTEVPRFYSRNNRLLALNAAQTTPAVSPPGSAERLPPPSALPGCSPPRRTAPCMYPG